MEAFGSGGVEVGVMGGKSGMSGRRAECPRSVPYLSLSLHFLIPHMDPELDIVCINLLGRGM